MEVRSKLEVKSEKWPPLLGGFPGVVRGDSEEAIKLPLGVAVFQRGSHAGGREGGRAVASFPWGLRGWQGNMMSWN